MQYHRRGQCTVSPFLVEEIHLLWECVLWSQTLIAGVGSKLLPLNRLRLWLLMWCKAQGFLLLTQTRTAWYLDLIWSLQYLLRFFLQCLWWSESLEGNSCRNFLRSKQQYRQLLSKQVSWCPCELLSLSICYEGMARNHPTTQQSYLLEPKKGQKWYHMQICSNPSPWTQEHV